MANRNFPSQRVYSMHVMMVQLNATITIGTTGAVASIAGKGIAAVTRTGVGQYQIQLEDNYNDLIQIIPSLRSPITGSAVTAGSFVAGTPYQITTLGTTNYNAIGLPAGVVAAIGVTFVASGVGAGTGTATAIGNSGIACVEAISGSAASNALLNNQPFIALSGGYVQVQCLGATSSSVTTLIPKDPVSGSVLKVIVLLSNSSVQ